MQKMRLMNAAGSARTRQAIVNLARCEEVTEITLGSDTYHKRDGNAGTTFQEDGDCFYSLNSVGMGNGGVDTLEERIVEAVRIAHDADKEVRYSIAGDTAAQFRDLSRIVHDCGADRVELNFGCPNVLDAGHADIWSFGPERMLEVIEQTQQVWGNCYAIKLSIYSDPGLLVRVATMLKERCFRGTELVLCNTFPKARLFAIDQDSKREGVQTLITPDGGLGGLSGKALLPIVLGQKEQFTRILGDHMTYVMVGGIDDGWSLAQHVCAGGDAFQVGTAFYRRDADASVFTEIFSQFVDIFPGIAEPYFLEV